MSRNAIPINDAPWNSSQVITWCTTSSPYSMVNDGKTELLVYMSAPAGNYCYIRSADDGLGRSVDILLSPPSSGTAVYRCGPFPSDGYNQSSDYNLMHIDFAGEGGGIVRVTAIRAHR